MNRPVHFEIHSTDPERVSRFYADVFGWKTRKWDGPAEYFLVDTGAGGEGINGGIMRSRDGQPRTVNTIKVQNVDEAAKKITAHGGTIVVPKMPIPGVGWLVYFTDPTGNITGVMQDDPMAR